MSITLAQADITDTEIAAGIAVLQAPYDAPGPRLKEWKDTIAKYAGAYYAVYSWTS